MPKLTVTEAEKLVPVKKSTIYADMETGKVSFEINSRGHKVIDPAELDRVYGLVKMPEHTGNGTGNQNGIERKNMETAGNGIGTHRKASETAGNSNDPTVDVVFLQREVARLEAELEAAGSRETELKTEKSELKEEKTKILDMLAIEQEKTLLLMLPDSEHGKNQKKRGSWLGYFRLKR